MDVMSVFIVHHVRQLPDGHDEVKLIGVYASPTRAQEAIDRTRSLEGFRDYPDGFSTETGSCGTTRRAEFSCIPVWQLPQKGYRWAFRR